MEPKNALSSHQITAELGRARDGDPNAAQRLTPHVYERLRRLASSYLAGERADHTLQPTALVHEAFLNLVGQDEAQPSSRAHFLAIAAVNMRRILIDHARRRGARRPSSGERVTLMDSHGDLGQSETDLLDLEEAMVRLAERNERQAKIVELRFFAGSTMEEIAVVLGFSSRQIKDNWRVARAWLKRELARGESEE